MNYLALIKTNRSFNYELKDLNRVGADVFVPPTLCL